VHGCHKLAQPAAVLRFPVTHAFVPLLQGEVMRKPSLLLLLVLVFAPFSITAFNVYAAEKTTVGGACSGDAAAADWDAIFQCVSSVWKRAAIWLGSSSDTCDSTKAGIIQWTGTSFQGCDGSSWTTFGGSGGSIPSGAVMAFNLASCPTGWSALDGTGSLPDARGRAIIGSGQGSGLTNRNRLDTGGEETHQLTIAEMPSHTHSYTTKDSTKGAEQYSGNWHGVATATTGSTGGDGAHNTMMPFLALLFCQKD